MAKVRVELESVWVGLEDDNSPFDSKVGIWNYFFLARPQSVLQEKEAKQSKEVVNGVEHAMEEAVNLQEQNNTELSNDELYRMGMIPTTKANKS